MIQSHTVSRVSENIWVKAHWDSVTLNSCKVFVFETAKQFRAKKTLGDHFAKSLIVLT